jgi:putative Holliday junction resolvase
MRTLGIDYGERRIGLAVSDMSGTLARPLGVVSVRGPLRERVSAVAAEVARTAAEPDGLALVVVGVPRALDGAPHDQTARALAFADALRAVTRVPVAFQDERLTSVEAEQRLAVRERDWRKRKARLDAAAAAVILQDYLDRPASERGSRAVAAEDGEPGRC